MNFVLVIFIITVVLLVAAIVFFQAAIKIVPEEKRIVILRMGRSIGSRGPGLVIVIPIIDFVMWVDVQKKHHFSYANLPTRDNKLASVVVDLEGKVSDAEKSVLNVPNLYDALQKLVEARVGDFVSSKSSSELPNLTGRLEDELMDAVRRAGRDWGFEADKIQIDNIQIV
jgi:regulator of protease activity HflC (stomatin/prohibitin superfamily)